MKKTAVIYWSGTGNTEAMANAVLEGMKSAGAEADLLTPDQVDPAAVKYETITYDDVLAQHLMVMDSTATSLSMDNHIPVLLFALKDPQNIIRALCGENVGTIVKE